jgi:molybdate transport system substrate-binding protein
MFGKFRTTAFLLLSAFGLLFAQDIVSVGATARAAEVKVLSANVFTGVLDKIAARFEQGSDHKVTIIYATAGVIRERIRSGEIGDVAILPEPMIQQLQQQGHVAPGIVRIARSAVGIAVRRGQPTPDIGSVDDVRRVLLAAKTISYPDPTGGGATGVLMTRIFKRLGITDDMKARAVFPPKGQFAADVVARGEAEIAIAQPMEVLSQPGLELVGLLPNELQSPSDFTFSTSTLVSAPERQAGREFIQFLTGPVAASEFKASRMEPG